MPNYFDPEWVAALYAAVESGQQTLDDIESFLFSGLSELMPEEGAELGFGGPVWVVRSIE